MQVIQKSFPPKGTIGVVVEYSSRDETVLVNWGKGSGVKPNVKNEYTWWCSVYRLEKSAQMYRRKFVI